MPTPIGTTEQDVVCITDPCGQVGPVVSCIQGHGSGSQRRRGLCETHGHEGLLRLQPPVEPLRCCAWLELPAWLSRSLRLSGVRRPSFFCVGWVEPALLCCEPLLSDGFLALLMICPLP